MTQCYFAQTEQKTPVPEHGGKVIARKGGTPRLGQVTLKGLSRYKCVSIGGTGGFKTFAKKNRGSGTRG